MCKINCPLEILKKNSKMLFRNGVTSFLSHNIVIRLRQSELLYLSRELSRQVCNKRGMVKF